MHLAKLRRAEEPNSRLGFFKTLKQASPHAHLTLLHYPTGKCAPPKEIDIPKRTGAGLMGCLPLHLRVIAASLVALDLCSLRYSRLCDIRMVVEYAEFIIW